MSQNPVIVPSHEALSSINNNLVCPEPNCNSSFKSSSNLKMHLVKTHKKSSNLGIHISNCLYHCPYDHCKYNIKTKKKSNSFTKFKYLKQHYLKCHVPKTLKCELCAKGFPTEAYLLAHTKTCGKKFICSCGWAYITKEALLTHCKRKKHSPTKEDFPVTSIEETNNMEKNTLVQVCIGSSQHSKSPRRPTHDIAVFPTHYVAAIALSELSTTLIIPKNCHIGVQTVETKQVRKSRSSDKKRKSSQETQTCSNAEKKAKSSAETQTIGESQHKPECRKICRSRKRSTETQTKDLMPFLSSVNSESLDCAIFNESSLSNSSSDSTKKCNLPLGMDDDAVWDKKMMTGSQSLIVKHEPFSSFDNLCNNETQTDVDSFFQSQGGSTSTIETQTTDDLIEDMYSNMCTQTCDETCDLFDFNFVDIETQTAWPDL